MRITLFAGLLFVCVSNAFAEKPSFVRSSSLSVNCFLDKPRVVCHRKKKWTLVEVTKQFRIALYLKEGNHPSLCDPQTKVVAKAEFFEAAGFDRFAYPYVVLSGSCRGNMCGYSVYSFLKKRIVFRFDANDFRLFGHRLSFQEALEFSQKCYGKKYTNKSKSKFLFWLKKPCLEKLTRKHWGLRKERFPQCKDSWPGQVYLIARRYVDLRRPKRTWLGGSIVCKLWQP